MIEAVIVSTARTPIGKAYRGALNNTEGPTMAGHVIGEAVRRAKVEPGEVEDVVMGCAMQQGTTAMNVARKGAIRPGLPVTVAGTTIDRQCASGLQAIAVAARSVMLDDVKIAVAGGIEWISLVQNEHMNKFHAVDDGLMGDEARDVYLDARDRRSGRGTLQDFARAPGRVQPRVPAPHRIRPSDYAVQVIYCRDKLGIDPEKLNVNGGSISMGHPYGMTGAMHHVGFAELSSAVSGRFRIITGLTQKRRTP